MDRLAVCFLVLQIKISTCQIRKYTLYLKRSHYDLPLRDDFDYFTFFHIRFQANVIVGFIFSISFKL